MQVMDLVTFAAQQSRSICWPLRGNRIRSAAGGGGIGVFDWAFLSTALEFLSSTGGVQRGLAELEQSLAENLGEAGSALLDFPPQALEVALTPTEEGGRTTLDGLHRALGKIRLLQGGDELHSMLESTMSTLATAEFLGEVRIFLWIRSLKQQQYQNTTLIVATITTTGVCVCVCGLICSLTPVSYCMLGSPSACEAYGILYCISSATCL